jgi:arylsulfatase A-like enzyme
MSDRPNILWLTYEDTSPQFVSCYGMTRRVTTPTIDALAAEGVRFDNAFATAPVCSASRSAIITGVCNEATGLGHHRSKYPLPRDLVRGFPWYLGQAGYYTTNNAKTDYNVADEPGFIAETWDESSTEAHWRHRPAAAPFFSVFNFMDSHQSRTMTKPWGWYEEHVLAHLAPDEITGPDNIDVPPFYRDTPEMRRHLSRVHNSLRLCDRRIAERLDELRADGVLEDTIVLCFADHGEGIPRGKCNGIGFGYRAAFVAWFPERYRHLNPWGSGVVTDELVSFEDLAPTVLSLAGVPIPAHMTGRAIAGPERRDPPRYIHAARNRLDDTPDLCRSTMDGRFVYTRNYFPHLPVVKYQKYSDVGDILRAIRRDYAAAELNAVQAELVVPRRPREYLYDLSADPWEITNLADNPAYRRDLERLREATLDHALETRDVMFLPEREMIARAGERSPYEARDDHDYNPLPELLRAADLVGAPGATDRQFELLDHPDDAVRYWAGVGLYADWRGLGEHVGRLRGHLDDPSPLVRIELAAALAGASWIADRSPDASAVGALSMHILSDDPLLAYQAVWKALYMPEIAEKFRESVERARPRWQADGAGGRSFPAREAIEMFRYLYCGTPLFYEDDAPYIDPAKQRRDW